MALALAWLAVPSGAATFNIDDLSEPAPSEVPDVPLASDSLPPDLARLLDTASDHFLASDFATAETAVRTLVDKAPDRGEGWHLLGLVLANQNRFDEALDALDRAAEVYRKNAEPLLIKADILGHLGRTAEAREAYAAAAGRDPSNWRANEAYARILEAEGAFDEARELYARAVTTAPPDRFFPSLRLARLLAEADDFGAAIDVVGRFSRSNPDNADALVALGRLLLADGHTDEAVRLLTTAAPAHPDDMRLLLLRAKAENGAGDVDQAIAILTDATDRFSDSPTLFFELGNLHAANRNFAAAADVYSDGLKASPEDRALLKGLSLAKYRSGEAQEALDPARRLASRDDAQAGDQLWLALVEEKLGNRDAAIGAYERALDLENGNWLAANNLAALLTGSDPQRAVELARRAADASGGLAAVRDTLGSAYLAADRADEAVEIFAALATEQPDDPKTAFRHGKALAAAGDTTAAKAEIERALGLSADFDGADEARSLLQAL